MSNCSCNNGAGDKLTQRAVGLLERPRYAPGLILEDSDLSLAVDYTRDLSRLLFRNLFGCGIVCGLEVFAKEDCGLEITVKPGLALDGCGDPVHLPRPLAIKLDQEEVEKFLALPREEEEVPALWVLLCGREKLCAPRQLVCDVEDDLDGATQMTRSRTLAEVSLAFKQPECICQCERPAGQARAFANSAPVDVPADCHYDHETRVGCAADCGCGTACACGCCLLLARIVRRIDPAGREEWQVVSRDIRRFIRPAMLPDPIDREEGWRGGSVGGEIWWGEMDDSRIYEAGRALYPNMKPGDVITREMALKMIAWANQHVPAS